MRPYALLLLGLSGATIALIWLFARQPLAPAAAPPPPPRPLAPAPGPSFTLPPAPIIAAPSTAVAPEKAESAAALPPLLADPAQAARRVAILLASRDPALLPEMGAYLRHPDPAVREKAADALLMMGDPVAAPWLREAAALEEALPNPSAAARLHAAADFVEQSPPFFDRPPPRPLAIAMQEVDSQTEVETQKPPRPDPLAP